MFDSINENVPDELTWNSYETCSSVVFHIPKAKMSCFSLNTLCYDGANLWNKFYHTLLYKEPYLTKEKLKKLLQMHFLDASAY